MVDCIVVLDEGHIVDVGTYEQVATKSATFASLLKAQSEGTSKVQSGMLLALYNTSKEPVCPRVELILKIIIILLIVFLGFIKSKPC